MCELFLSPQIKIAQSQHSYIANTDLFSGHKPYCHHCVTVFELEKLIRKLDGNSKFVNDDSKVGHIAKHVVPFHNNGYQFEIPKAKRFSFSALIRERPIKQLIADHGLISPLCGHLDQHVDAPGKRTTRCSSQALITSLMSRGISSLSEHADGRGYSAGWTG
jgi:hypothetical protein